MYKIKGFPNKRYKLQLKIVGTIIGSIIGVVIFLVIAAVISVLIFRRNKHNNEMQSRDNQNNQITEISKPVINKTGRHVYNVSVLFGS